MKLDLEKQNQILNILALELSNQDESTLQEDRANL